MASAGTGLRLDSFHLLQVIGIFKRMEEKKTKIIFVCHGNICRSPMAEFIFRHLAEEVGRKDEFEISSAAVSYE